MMAGQIDGTAQCYKAFNSAVNTNLNVRNTTQADFILHTLKSQWTNTYIKNV